MLNSPTGSATEKIKENAPVPPQSEDYVVDQSVCVEIIYSVPLLFPLIPQATIQTQENLHLSQHPNS